jgi:hypothetical protein
VRTILAAVWLALLAAPALASGSVPPPARYDHSYRGKLTVVYLDHLQIRRVCGGLAVACAVVGKGRCTVYMSGLDNWKTRITRRHEIAHCNGWRH